MRNGTAGVLLCLIAACEGDRGLGRQRGPELVQLTAIEELRIGRLDHEVYSFTSPIFLTVTPWGDLIVGESVGSTIRVFDPSGRFIWSVGRRGQGPAEFTRLVAVGVLGGEIYAVDIAQAKIEYFDRSGDHLRTETYRTPYGEDTRPTPPFVLFPDSSGIVAPTMLAKSERAMAYLRVDRLGSVIDTIVTFPLSDTHVLLQTPGGGVLTVRKPFGGPAPHAYHPAGASFWSIHLDEARPDRFSVVRRTKTGDTVYARTYQAEAVPISQAERDSARASFFRIAESAMPGRIDVRNALAEQIRLPSHHRPVLRAIGTQEGHLWLQRPLPIEGGLARWEIHDEEGTPRAVLDLPSEVDVIIIRGDELWAVEHDELGVPYIVRLRLIGLPQIAASADGRASQSQL